MANKVECLAVIPAREGSKKIFGKTSASWLARRWLSMLFVSPAVRNPWPAWWFRRMVRPLPPRCRQMGPRSYAGRVYGIRGEELMYLHFQEFLNIGTNISCRDFLMHSGEASANTAFGLK